MERKIVIQNCEQCPYKDHQGGFGNPAYKPCCTKMGRRELAYKVDASGRGGRMMAIYDGKIPTWCPLELNEVVK